MQPNDASLSQHQLALSAALDFLQKHFGRMLILSFVLLFPCVWHPHIQAGDLGSHVYNAWLAQLAEQGNAPGVYVRPAME